MGSSHSWLYMHLKRVGHKQPKAVGKAEKIDPLLPFLLEQCINTRRNYISLQLNCTENTFSREAFWE